jgi:hypothetical protein
MTLKVQDRSPEVEEMARDWSVCEALMEGTAGMREAGEEFLPRWPGEDVRAHETRLKTATLFPAYRRTVTVMAGKPFSKALTYGDDVPPRIRELCEDVDLQGRNLHAFAADAFVHAVGYGIGGILVDYPKVMGVQTLADERQAGARPYMTMVEHDAILGWRAKLIGGMWQLTQLRLAEEAEVEDGRFGIKCVKRVRVLEPGRYELWQEPEADSKIKDYTLVEEGPTSIDVVPFVPFYGAREEFLEGYPPLIDLAWLNVKHWQSQSDQDNITHVARVPILAATGIDDTNWSLVVGSGTAVKLPTGSTLTYVEHSGAAISAGRDSLKDLEAQMIQTGAELLVKQPGDRSATEAANDADGNKSHLQRIAEQFEDALDAALQLMAKWLNLPEGGRVTLFKDFGAASLGQASGQLVLAMQQGGLISKPTAIREMQRRGELDAGIEPDDELAMVDTQGPALGAMEFPPITEEAPVSDKPPMDGSPDKPGDKPTDKPDAPKETAPDKPHVDMAELARVLAEAIGRIPGAVVNVPEQAAPIVNMPPITVEGSTINVTTPEQQAPSVTVNQAPVTVNTPEITMPAVNVAPATVTVNMPEQAAPVVNVAPPNVAVTVEKGGNVRFIEDAAGNLTGAVME